MIDDYHLITNPVIHDAMRFSYGISRKISTVVLSRNLPQLPGIASLRVRDQLLEIGSQQLAQPASGSKAIFTTVVFRRPLKPLRQPHGATMWPDQATARYS